jgi:hypothetical protein
LLEATLHFDATIAGGGLVSIADATRIFRECDRTGAERSIALQNARNVRVASTSQQQNIDTEQRPSNIPATFRERLGRSNRWLTISR